MNVQIAGLLWPDGARRWAMGLVVGLSAAGLNLPLSAQVHSLDASQLSEQQMVEQLKGSTPAATEPRASRRLRTLHIESAPAVTDPETAPSLSLLIQFDFDSDRIRPESEAPLRRLANAINAPELAESNFAIEGHTDAQGDADYNLRLSERRAYRVKTFLIQHGVSAGRLYAVGKGAQEPAHPTDPYADENRRVRVVNLR